VLKYPILAILHLISQRHNIVHFKVCIISICEVKMINIQVDFNPKLLIKKDFFLLAITNEFTLFIVNFIYCYYIWS
jgi:hypothetical protein